MTIDLVFGMMGDLDPLQFKLEGQGHGSKFRFWV